MPYSFERPDLAPEKPPRVAVREQLLDLLATQPHTTSTGGKVHVFLNCPNGDNSFAVPLSSRHLHGWLTVRHVARQLPAPSDSQIRQALRIKEAQCLGGTTRNLRSAMNVRYAWDSRHLIPTAETDIHGMVKRNYFNAPNEPAYVLSLDAERGRHVSITATRWLLQPSQATFLYDPIQQPMADPIQPIDEPDLVLKPFRRLLRLEDSRHDATWRTLLDWTLAAMRAPKDPMFHSYPILNLMGPENSGKSVAAKLLTQLLDPTLTPVHSIPATERRLHALAASHHVLTFDDTGKINPEKSRYLSRLSSGVTSLYKPSEVMIVRPIILTTSDEAETKHLANKVVDLDLPPVEHPLPEEEIQTQFDAMRPHVLGALLTLLVRNFNAPPEIRPNRKSKIQKIEQSVTEFLEQNGGTWQGTAADLARHIASLTARLTAGVTQALACDQPISPESMGRIVDQLTTIQVTRPQRKNHERPIHLTLRPPTKDSPQAKPKRNPEATSAAPNSPLPEPSLDSPPPVRDPHAVLRSPYPEFSNQSPHPTPILQTGPRVPPAPGPSLQ